MQMLNSWAADTLTIFYFPKKHNLKHIQYKDMMLKIKENTLGGRV